MTGLGIESAVIRVAAVGMLLGGGGCGRGATAVPPRAPTNITAPTDEALRDAAQEAARRGDYGFALRAFERLGDAARAEAIRGQRKAAGRTAPVPRGPWLAVRTLVLAAEVAVDGDEAMPAPRFVSLAPGRHEVAIEAEGYETSLAVVKLEADDVFVVDAELRPAPASLDLGVDVPDGVGVYVDGAYMATTPLAEPLRIEGGPHDVVVAANGREPFETRIALERGEFRLLKPHLPVTGQRIGAIAALVAGGLGIGTSIGTGLAGQAGTFDDATKDTLFRVSTGTGVAGFLLSFVGGALFVFDAPDVDVVSGPGDAGVGARARF